jgi:hypothetical protein
VVRRLALIIGVAFMALTLVADAAETPPAPGDGGSTAPGVPPDDPAVQANMPGCAVWTDRCVTCTRADDVADTISCSNTGIACQPQALTCLRPRPADGKKGGN